MFVIKYRVVEDVNELRLITPIMFDKDPQDFKGQIEFNFNGSKIGHIFEEEISQEMFDAGCFQDEWVMWWFESLIKVVKLLRENSYLILAEHECSNWIEFKKKDNTLHIKEFREVPHNIRGFRSASKPLMSVTTLSETIQLNTGKTYTRAVDLERTEFPESFISFSEFEQEVIIKAKAFLSEVLEVFPNLANSKTINTFAELLNSIDD